jgi:hypothetical protein
VAIDTGALAKRLVQERPELKNRHYAILVTNEDGDEMGGYRWTSSTERFP